jgi:dihydrofolate reductase/uncharacterized protein YndB with AHSA1/START domain
MDEARGAVVADVTVSLDGFVAGDGVSVATPLGEGGEALAWYGDAVNDASATSSGSYDPVDAEVLAEAGAREGAVIMGRTTFDVSIDAWGDEPPIRKPCFVVTNRPAPPVVRKGGTTFTFVSSPWEALREARRAAGGRGVGIMGGAGTIRQYLMAGLLDELHLHVVPVVLGSGVRLFEHPGLAQLRFHPVRVRDGRAATHLLYRSGERIDRAWTVVEASPEEVYRAFADPGALQRWLPPGGMTGTMLEFDFRVGGGHRMRLTYAAADRGRGKTAEDADDVAVRITKLQPARAIHQEIEFASDAPRFHGAMRMTWSFRPHGDATLVTVEARDVPDGILPEDHAEGLHASVEQLARFVTAGR